MIESTLLHFLKEMNSKKIVVFEEKIITNKLQAAEMKKVLVYCLFITNLTLKHYKTNIEINNVRTPNQII